MSLIETEEILRFGNKNSLLGIISRNKEAIKEKLPIVILLNAGFIHRIGPNRIYVELARKLANKSIMSLRFDFSGIGDSSVSEHNLPDNERFINELKQAMDILYDKFEINEFIIAGICSGADVALRASFHDDRVKGIIVINNLFFDPALNKKKNKYDMQYRLYHKKIFKAENWLRVLTGKSDYLGFIKATLFKLKNIPKLIISVIVAPIVILYKLSGYTIKLKKNLNLKRIKSYNKNPGSEKNNILENRVNNYSGGDTLSKIIQNKIKALFIFSEGSESYLPFGQKIVHLNNDINYNNWINVKLFEDADHVFTPVWSQQALIGAIENWIENEYVAISKNAEMA